MQKFRVFFSIAALLVSYACGQQTGGDTPSGWKPLFNHQNLEGWHASPGGNWKVSDGYIVGTSPADEPLHGILLHDGVYDDFELKVVYKAIKGNSGVYFRVDEVDDPVHVYGLQAEIDPEKDAGGLYETGGRNWVVQPTPENVKKWYKPNEWNEMVIICKGKDVTVYLNGFKTAELHDDPGRTKGLIGLQLHGNMEMNVLFKDILIKED
ncbi:3-keto-disaccharide hydrolase [Parapedobacter sp. DT-150]|uniref:3-keto-disaccharide hydrolase n=1 Tax=Parapedobacter sp. DT-150 TaxID=3396162 RepID=UPI003F1E2F32